MEALSRLYAIADRAALDARAMTVRTFAEEMRAAGVRLLQYRDKTHDPQEVLRVCAEISDAFAGSGATLVLNDRADLALLAGWTGVHVGQGDLPPDAARRVLCGGDAGPFVSQTSRQGLRGEGGTLEDGQRRRCVVGVSTHTDAQVKAAGAGCADYVAVGPVFATGSKSDAEPVIGLAGVRRARVLTAKPLVAIGGITRENAASVIEAGGDAVAVIGALLVPGERPGKVAEEFLRILR